MNSNKRQPESVTRPLLKRLKDQEKATSKKIETPSTGSDPLEPADLYQDSGEGYNPDFTFPQT